MKEKKKNPSRGSFCSHGFEKKTFPSKSDSLNTPSNPRNRFVFWVSGWLLLISPCSLLPQTLESSPFPLNEKSETHSPKLTHTSPLSLVCHFPHQWFVLSIRFNFAESVSLRQCFGESVCVQWRFERGQ